MAARRKTNKKTPAQQPTNKATETNEQELAVVESQPDHSEDNDDALDAALAMIAQDDDDTDTGTVSAGGMKVDDDLEDALAEIEASSAIIDGDTGDVEASSDTTETVAAAEEEEEVEVEIDDNDVEIALKNLEADDKNGEAAKSTKPKKRESGGDAARKVEVQLRKFSDVASLTDKELDERRQSVTAKKVREKVDNVIAAIESGKKLSRYTVDAVKALVKDGRVSGKSLTQTYLDGGLKDGTARAQSQQLTAVFKALGVAAPDPNNNRELVVADKPLLDELVKLAA